MQSTVELIEAIKLAEFELRGVDDLVRVGPVWRSFNIQRANEIIENRGKGKQHTAARGAGFRLDLGKTAGGVKGPDTLPEAVTLKRLTNFLGKQR